MAKLAELVKNDVKRILAESNVDGAVAVQGSYARDTWISRETDLDVFARFPATMERDEWETRVLPALRKGFSKFQVIERYAEHPFLEFEREGVRVNVVPSYDTEKGHWKSATDRTPYHTEFMLANLTSEMRSEARLLKKFAKGIGVYGAEIKTGGFSGMLVDTLALYYHTFLETLRQSASWTAGTLLEIGKVASLRGAKEREVGTDLVVIDPIDPNRNLAAAVRQDKLWSFVAAGRQFLQNPSTQYFFPPAFKNKTRKEFSDRLSSTSRNLVAITFKHPILVQDVLWGQLLKFEKSIVQTLTREGFQPYRSTIWSDEKTESAILAEVDHATLPIVKLQSGPPIAKTEDSLSFLQRHQQARDTARGPWIERDRWIVEKSRSITTIPDLVKAGIRQEAYGLKVPTEIGKMLPRSLRVLEGREVLTLLGKPGFDETLWKFLEAKPLWLRPVH